MDCKETQSKITPYLRGQLEEKEELTFIEHVQNCPACKAELADYHMLLGVIDEYIQKTDNRLSKGGNIKDVLNLRMEESIKNYKKKKSQLLLYNLFFSAIVLALLIFSIL